MAFANQTAAVSMTGTWSQWNLQYVLSTSATTVQLITGYAEEPWQYWNGAYTSGNYTYATGGTIGYSIPWETWNTQHEYTAEQLAAQAERRRQNEVQQEQWRQDRERLNARQAVVNSRAEQLLMSLLSDEQRRTRREHGWFEVRGSLGGRWRIRNRGQSGNVDLMPQTGNERLMSFCIHPPDRLPDADAHVAQMLGIVTDELAFRRTGNVTYRRADVARDVDRATIGLPVLAPVPVLGQQNRGPLPEQARHLVAA